MANLIPEKGIDVLLRAVAQMRTQAMLDIVGDGAQQQALIQLSQQLGLADRVRFLGLRDDVPQLLAQSHVFVHPATWTEAFGLTIAEAMACGRPVIASRVGGIPEIVEDGTSGILFEAGDSARLARELDGLASNPARCIALAEQARLRVERRFTLTRCANEHINVLEQVGGIPMLFETV